MSDERFEQGSQAELVGDGPEERLGTSSARRFESRFRFAIIAFVIAFVVFGAVLWATGRLDYQTVGYPGIWLISLIGAGSIVLPVPGLAAVCAGAAPGVGLNPVVIGILAATAEALGELTGYLAGLSGTTILERHRLYPRFREWLIRRGGIVLFVLAAVPNPVFDLIGIAAGSVRYPMHRFLIVVFLGKAIKSTGIAYGCYFGVGFVNDLVQKVF